jgi:hypothetical protein
MVSQMTERCSSEPQSQKSPSLKTRKLGKIGISRLQAYDFTLDDKKVLRESSDDFEISGNNSKVIWRLSEDKMTWNFRKLVARDNYLYILSSAKNGDIQVVDRIPMSFIRDPQEWSNQPSFPAYRFSEDSVQNRRKKSIPAQSSHFISGTPEYFPKYDSTVKVESRANAPALDIHAFTFWVDESEFKQRNVKRKKRGGKKEENIKLSRKQYIFRTEAKEYCEQWIKTIKETSISAHRTAQRLKRIKWLQGALREVYSAKPFQVPRQAPYHSSRRSNTHA